MVSFTHLQAVGLDHSTWYQRKLQEIDVPVGFEQSYNTRLLPYPSYPQFYNNPPWIYHFLQTGPDAYVLSNSHVAS